MIERYRTHSLVASFGLIAFVYVIAGSLILSLRTHHSLDVIRN